MSRVNAAHLDLTLDDNKWQSGASRVTRTMRGMQQKMDAVARTARRMLLVGGAAFAGLIKLASDFEEDTGKFRAVFKGNSDAVLEWARVTADATQRSVAELVRFLSSVQDTFVPLGFARDQAAALSQQVVQLAIDLGSFNNEAEPQVIQALTSALVGQHRAVQRYGIVINEATIAQKAFQQGLNKSVKDMTPAEKAMARLAIIIDSTSDAQGDAVRTAGSFANQLRGLTSSAKDLAVEIGTQLLPMATRWITALREGLPEIAAWIEKNKEMIVTVAKWGAATLAVMVVLPKVISLVKGFAAVITFLIPAVEAAGAAMLFMGGPLTLLVAAFAAVLATGLAFVAWIKGLEKDLDAAGEASKEAAKNWNDLSEAQERAADATDMQSRLSALRDMKASLERLKAEQIEMATSDAPWYLRNNAAGNAAKIAEQIRGISREMARLTATGRKARGDDTPAPERERESEESKSLREEVDKLTQRLEIQRDTFGMTSEAVAIYELKLKGANGGVLLGARLAAQDIEFKKRQAEATELAVQAINDEAQARRDRRATLQSELDALQEMLKTEEQRDAEFKERLDLFQREGLLTEEQVNRLMEMRKQQEAVNASLESLEGTRRRVLEAAASRRRSDSASSSATSQKDASTEKTAKNTTTIVDLTKISNDKLDDVILALKKQELGFK